MIRPVVFVTGLIAMLAVAPPLWAAGAADSIRIDDPLVRAVPPGQDQTGAYLTLLNTGQQNHSLVKVISPAARVAELHTVVDDGGMKMMRPVTKINVAAGGVTRLQPGGLHIMLIGLKQPLAVGTTVPIALVFEDGSQKSVSAPVRAISAPGSMMHGH